MAETETLRKYLKKVTADLRRANQRLQELEHQTQEPVAVLGMACRFPGGVMNVDDFWQLLIDGRDAVRLVPADRWDPDAFLDPDPAMPGKAYTQTAGFIDDLAGFDAEFFGLSPGEALRMDPQQRLLLELSWAALEHAGIAPDQLRGTRTGAFVGIMAGGDYTQLQLESEGAKPFDDPLFGLGNAASVTAGRIAYLLDLHGPAIPTDTACSSALVSTHIAVRSLRDRECDLAIVGGASAICHPSVMVQACKMGMLARDNRSKTFDAQADGFAVGEGAGVVVLGRLRDAVANKHPVLALIEGSAVNQDGRTNGLTAPSRPAQAAVIRSALQDAGVEPGGVDYVEAHGSGTQLGDAVEVAALGDVFAERPSTVPPLQIGSAKTNIGHLQAAAGIVGLIKAVLMVNHGEIPKSLHLSEVNPALELEDVGLRPARERTGWPSSPHPRRVGISSFGWSGTNAHAVVRAANESVSPHTEDDCGHPLALSAASPAALTDVARRLRARLESPGAPPLHDVAFTLALGRTAFPFRLALVCRDTSDAVEQLASLDESAITEATRAPRIGLVLRGSVSREHDRLCELHRHEPAFQRALQEVTEAAAELFERPGLNLLDCMPESGRSASHSDEMPDVAQFAIQFALVGLLRSWGVRPCALLGSSVAEYVTACCAGLLTLKDALLLVSERARLLRSGARGEPEFEQRLSSVHRNPPHVPLVSARGTWITSDHPESVAGWTPALRPQPAELAGLHAVATRADVILEVGATEAGTDSPSVWPQQIPIQPADADRPSLLAAAAFLWTHGTPLEWHAYFRDRSGGRVHLPTYPFQHTRYWPERRAPTPLEPDGRQPDLADRCYTPSWKPAPDGPTLSAPPGPSLVFAASGLAERVAGALSDAGDAVTIVLPGDRFAVSPGGLCHIDPGKPEHYSELLTQLADADASPRRVVHAWATGVRPGLTRDATLMDVDSGFASVLLLAQALAGTDPRATVELTVATTGAMNVLGDEGVAPTRAMLPSLCRCISTEHPSLRCRYVDLDAADVEGKARQLGAELALDVAPEPVAWRGRQRWMRTYESTTLREASEPVWRQRGIYLITGGMGGLGLVLARHLAKTVRARLVLVGRSPLPPREDWDRWISEGEQHESVTRLKNIIELEEAGSEVLVATADVGDPAAVREVVAAAKTRFGGLNGVVHAAGVPGRGLFQFKTRAEVDAVLRPKVLGTLALAEALRGEPLDFLALYSSSAAALGGLGESDYAAANAFMDAWAASADLDSCRRVVSVAWGAWSRDTWQQEILAEAPELVKRARQYRERFGIADNDGVELLTRILASSLSTALILPEDPATTAHRITELLGADGLRPPARQQVFPRPELRSPYNPPRTEIERRLERIWAEQLGLERVGIDDAFFELGGSSLIGLSIRARIESELSVRLAVSSLFESPNIRALANLIDGQESHDSQIRNALMDHAARGERRHQRAMTARHARTGRSD